MHSQLFHLFIRGLWLEATLSVIICIALNETTQTVAELNHSIFKLPNSWFYDRQLETKKVFTHITHVVILSFGESNAIL